MRRPSLRVFPRTHPDPGMAISLTIDLSDRDLEHFTQAMEKAKTAAAHKTPADVVAAAGALLADAQKVHLPDFIRERLVRLDDMIARSATRVASRRGRRNRVMSCWFTSPIRRTYPRHVEVLGFLDDAIMIEMSVRELQHELDAYDDFCDYREREAKKRGTDRPRSATPTGWRVAARSCRAHAARRERDFVGIGYGSSSGYRGKANYTRAWRPSLFKLVWPQRRPTQMFRPLPPSCAQRDVPGTAMAPWHRVHESAPIICVRPCRR